MKFPGYRWSNAIAVLLVGLAFSVSLYHVALRPIRETDGRTVLRIAHFHLHGGLREAYDAAIRVYEELNPGVSVRQIAIPIRVFPTWQNTQLLGNPPDLLIISRNLTFEQIAREVLPITAELEAPNPYNIGTELEGVPWRETFVDHLEGGRSGQEFEYLRAYFSVPTQLQSTRTFWNMRLLREIVGNERLPETYEEIIEIFEATRQFAADRGRILFPIAGSNYTVGELLLDRLFGQMTQRLQGELARTVHLSPTPADLTIAFLLDRFSLETPEIRAGWELIREFCGYMQPAFDQANRDDAIFLFSQERALTVVAGSQDIESIRSQANFPVSVGPLPYPTSKHPRFGRFVVGPPIESADGLGNFGVMRRSHAPEQALDFLKFLTSQRAAQIFVDVGGRLPATRGTRMESEILRLLPNLVGYRAGFSPNAFGLESRRAIATNLNFLTGAQGSVDRFVAEIERPLRESARRDLRLHVRNAIQTIRHQDVQLAAMDRIAAGAPDEGSTDAAFALFRAQNTLEEVALRSAAVLRGEFEPAQ